MTRPSAGACARLEEMNRAFRSKFQYRKVRGYEDMYKRSAAS